MAAEITVVDHPLLKRDLTILRRKETPHGLFRKTLSDAAAILAYESMRHLAVREVSIETPLEPTTGFMMGKFKVSGDMSVALKLRRVV